MYVQHSSGWLCDSTTKQMQFSHTAISFKYLTATKFNFFTKDKQDEETMEGMNMSMSGSAEGGAMETMAMPEFPDTSDAIWWFRTMPGRTGNFIGHFIPAMAFAFFGGVQLLVALQRCRNLPPGKSFAELHIPERNPVFLKTMSYVVMIATSVGIVFEGMGGLLYMGNFFTQLAHITLYFSYFIVGVCGYFESQGRLAPDTHRAAFVMALIAGFLMWYSHGTMKKLLADQSVHELLGYVNLVNAGVVAYSMRYTDSVFAFLGGFAMLVLQSIWLITAGFYECCYDLPAHEIATYLALQSLIVFLIIALVVAFYGPEPSEQDNLQFRQDFSPLKDMNEDDIDGDDHGGRQVEVF